MEKKMANNELNLNFKIFLNYEESVVRQQIIISSKQKNVVLHVFKICELKFIFFNEFWPCAFEFPFFARSCLTEARL